MTDVADRREVYLRAQALVSRVYALPVTERDAFVEEKTQADPALRDEVRWLLEALSAPDDEFLDPAAAGLLVEENELKVPAPRNYTLIRPLGEGGMGVVYLAERVEGELKQVVALKLLNLVAMLNPMVVSRFLTERQLLAKLNHPNIARLIDAGALADGRPFLAMEYVEGEELDLYCEAHNLGIPERLKLFLKVCSAVQYAHQHLIIHRDLKPANVLVTKEGEPKLVDFGIARIESGKEGVTTQTMGVERIMTLAYASPEQLSGKPLSTTTDVYSLGVMLYELLAGGRPWGDHADPLALAKQIGDSEPIPPSAMRQKTRGQAAAEKKGLKTGWRWRLPRDLPRDLDAIVLKALRLNPEDRYDSVQALALDLMRFQTNRPVKAREGRTWYWLSKYARRNWLSLTVTAAIVAMTAGYIVDRQLQLKKTEQERAKVEQVRDFLIGLFREVQPAYTKGENISAREMLDRGEQRLKATPPADPVTRFVLTRTLAETYQSLGEYRQASRLAKNAAESALANPEIDARMLGQTLMNVSIAEGMLQNHKESEKYARDVLALASSGRQIPPSMVADAKVSVGVALELQSRPEAEWRPPIEEALAILEKDPGAGGLLASTRRDFAERLNAIGKCQEGLEQIDKAIVAFGRMHGANHPSSLTASSMKGMALDCLERIAEAQITLEEALRTMEFVLGQDHFQAGLARTYLANNYVRQEKWEKAEPLHARQLALTRKVQKYESRSTFNAILNHSSSLAMIGGHAQAEALAREAVALVDRAFPPEAQDESRNTALIRLAITMPLPAKRAEVERIANEVKSRTASQGTQLRASNLLGESALKSSNVEGALRHFGDAVSLSKGKSNVALLGLAQAQLAAGQRKEAEATLLPVVNTLKRIMPADAPIRKRAVEYLQKAYREQGKVKEAAALDKA
jgi:eukaryotic-like serine/threonine-protein kinase